MMPAERTTTAPITDVGIREAIKLKCSACFGALMVCRGLSGAGFEDEEWHLAKTFTLKDLVEEATKRGIDFTGCVNVDGDPVLNAIKFKHAKGDVTDAELDYWWRGVKNGTIDTDGRVL